MLSRNYLLHSRYRIIRPLGKGGFGQVYEALDDKLDCIVALKEGLAKLESEKLRRAFEREAKLLANLRHPALPKVTDHFFEGDGQYLVMEFVEGDDLATLLLKRQFPFPFDQVLSWADEVLKALTYLHTRQEPIVHRDVKPANIKLTSEGEIFLLDFGLAKGYAGEMTLPGTSQRSSSVHGYTAAYAPLEQLNNSGTNEQSDIYSLGATLYHLLTGRVPVTSSQRYKSTDMGGHDSLQPPHEVNPSVPEPISIVVLRAMALSRRDRIRSASLMREALMNARLSLQQQPAIDSANSFWQQAPVAIASPSNLELRPGTPAMRDATPSEIGPPIPSPADNILSTPSKELSWPSQLASDAVDSRMVSTVVDTEVHTEAMSVSVLGEETDSFRVTEHTEIKCPSEAETTFRAPQEYEQEMQVAVEADQAAQLIEEERKLKEAEAVVSPVEVEPTDAHVQEEDGRESRESEVEPRVEEVRFTHADPKPSEWEPDTQDERDIERQLQPTVPEKAQRSVPPRKATTEKKHRARGKVVRARIRESESKGKPAHIEPESNVELVPNALVQPDVEATSEIQEPFHGTPGESTEENTVLAGIAEEAHEITLLSSPPVPETEAELVATQPIQQAQAEPIHTIPMSVSIPRYRLYGNWLVAGFIALVLVLAATYVVVRLSGTKDPVTQSPSATAKDFVFKQVLDGPAGKVSSVAFSRDGRLLAFAGESQLISLWDALTLTPRYSLADHQGTVNSIAFSPDNQTLASASNDNSIKLWDVRNGSLLKTLSGQSTRVLVVAFSPTGQLLATAGEDKKILLWDVETGSLTRSLSGHRGQILALAFPSDATTLASAGKDDEIKFWDIQTGVEKKSLSAPGILSLAFSRDGTILASGHADKTVRLWNWAHKLMTHELTGHESYVTAVTFNSNGRSLITGSLDKTIRIWNLASGEMKQTLTGHTEGINALTISSDDQTLLSAGRDQTVRVWKTNY